ncbi:MAG: hypothetical protein H7Z19_07430 [Chitinophagaceae bacterium]|nr:hypothetical protein [Rubrivivax sp.]
MATRYLTDTDAWLCICAARLAEISDLSATDCDAVAHDLYRDEVLRRLDPIAAAETHAAAGPGQVAA